MVSSLPTSVTRSLLLVLALSLLATASGCYRFALSDIEPGSVYLVALTNRTFYREFDEQLNSDLAAVFARTSGFTIAKNREGADLIVSGEIQSVSKSVIRTGEGSMPLEYLYGCLVSVQVHDTRKETQRTLEVKRSWRYLPPYGEDELTALTGLSLFMAEETVRSITRQW